MAVPRLGVTVGFACGRLALVLAFLLLLAHLALSGALPDLVYAVGFRIGVAGLGPCVLPVEVEVVLPAEDRTFRAPLSWDQCSRCTLAQDVPRWNAALLVDQQPAPSHATREPSCNRSSSSSQWVDKAEPRFVPRPRETWRSEMGRKPLVISRARPIKPSEGLPQVGGCSTVKQMHAFMCQAKEVGHARAEGLVL